MIYGIHIPTRIRVWPYRLLRSVEHRLNKEKVSYTIQRGGLPECDFLILYGWGGAQQQRIIQRHQGNYIAFDLGYWGRSRDVKRKWRASINGFHCPELMALGPTPSDSRLRQDGIRLVNTKGKKNGPILLVGNSPKSQRVGARNWSQKKSRELQKMFPDRKVWYKPKPGRSPEAGVIADRIVEGEIQEILPQCSLVVSRHSNVGIDAARMGVPVVIEDGAASMIYPSSLQDWKLQPSKEERYDLLCRVSWWQWSINEIRCGAFYDWFRQQSDSLPRPVSALHYR